MNYIYLHYGTNKKYDLEFLYSLGSLIPHVDKHHIYCYTEQPEKFQQLGINIVDIKDRIDSWSNQRSYMHRLKAKVIQYALQETHEKTIFIDSDTIFNGNPQPLFSTVADHKVMLHAFEKKNPCPQMKGFQAHLAPNLRYHYQANQSYMYNSGIIGVDVCHLEILEQVISLIDQMQPQFPDIHTVEQLCFSEIFRINKITINTCHRLVTHYWRSTLRQYMHHHLNHYFNIDHPYSAQDIYKRKRIKLNYLRAKLFKLGLVTPSIIK